MNRYIILLIICLFNNLQAASYEDDEEIVVKLATDSKLMPIYLTPFYQQAPTFDASYIRQLEQVLSFDLNYNGMTTLVKQTKEHDAIVGAAFTDFPQTRAWRNLNAYYVLKVLVKERSISAKLLSVNSNEEKSIDNLPLTGDIAQDRRQIHRLADLIHKTLFGTDGIANTHIIYTVKPQANKPISDIWEADYDGANARQITRENTLIVTPTYIPPKPGFSSGSLLYISYKTGQSKIYAASLKDGIGRRVTLLKGNQLMPAISRQRDKIAFICDYTGNPDLFMQSFDAEKGVIGKPQQIFATHLATQGTPSFSPDGNRVAFVSNKDGSPRIYVLEIPAPGASIKDLKPTLISKVNRENTAPAWSPDGKKIAYCAKNGDARQIWIYDFDKRKETQLTQGKGDKENPTWAPNSLHLIFNSTGNKGSELYLINLNQPEAIKISSGAGEKRFPSWGN